MNHNISYAAGTQVFRLNLGGRESVIDFLENDWFLYEYAPKQESGVKKIHLHFTKSAGWQVNDLIKRYALWRLGRVKPVTVRLELTDRLSFWENYLCAKGIDHPAKFTAADYGAFLFWLRAKGIRAERCDRILSSVHLMLTTGQRLGWHVTRQKLPINLTDWHLTEQSVLSGVTDWQSPVAQTQRTGGTTQPIPDAVYSQILAHAISDETDEITRCGILIQSQTGLRISEVLSLRADCLKIKKDGTCSLTYQLKKTQRDEPAAHEIPANQIVCEAIRRLRDATEDLRRESGKTQLFLIKNHGIRQVSQTNWNSGRLANFLKRWQITDASGNIYRLHSHQFRATYVTRQLADGVPIEMLRRQLGHVTPEMTMRYVHMDVQTMQDYLTPYIGDGEVVQ